MNNLATPYDLPFEAHHSPAPLFAARGDVRVDVDLVNTATKAAVDALDGVIIAFTELASTGALAGDRIPPWESRLAGGYSGPTVSGPTQYTWILKGCFLDEAALLVLVHLFLDPNVTHPVRRVVVAGATRPQRLAHDPDIESPYPAAFGQIPFHWEIDEDVMDAPTLFVRFQASPADAQRKEISATLLTWAAATAMGAYPVAPELPRDCGMAVDSEIPFIDEDLEWSFAKFYAHPDSLFGLVNALAAVSKQVAPVEEVQIE